VFTATLRFLTSGDLDLSTFSSENWHSTFSYVGNVYTNVDFFYVFSFSSYKPVRDRRTGKTRKYAAYRTAG